MHTQRHTRHTNWNIRRKYVFSIYSQCAAWSGCMGVCDRARGYTVTISVLGEKRGLPSWQKFCLRGNTKVTGATVASWYETCALRRRTRTQILSSGMKFSKLRRPNDVPAQRRRRRYDENPREMNYRARRHRKRFPAERRRFYYRKNSDRLIVSITFLVMHNENTTYRWIQYLIIKW